MVCRSLTRGTGLRGPLGDGMRRIGSLIVLLILVTVAIVWLRSISG
jgi:hypothetical protein